MIALGIAVAYLVLAVALLWPRFAPILRERGPQLAPPTTRVDEARRELAAAMEEAERLRRIEALRAQIDDLQAELDRLGNKPADPDVYR